MLEKYTKEATDAGSENPCMAALEKVMIIQLEEMQKAGCALLPANKNGVLAMAIMGWSQDLAASSLIEYLIHSGVDINATITTDLGRGGLRDYTFLEIAIRKNNAKAAEILLQHGANHTDDMNLLIHCIDCIVTPDRKKSEIVMIPVIALLLKTGANPDMMASFNSSESFTPLVYAAYNKITSYWLNSEQRKCLSLVIKALLKRGASVPTDEALKQNQALKRHNLERDVRMLIKRYAPIARQRSTLVEQLLLRAHPEEVKANVAGLIRSFETSAIPSSAEATQASVTPPTSVLPPSARSTAPSSSNDSTDLIGSLLADAPSFAIG